MEQADIRHWIEDNTRYDGVLSALTADELDHVAMCMYHIWL